MNNYRDLRIVFIGTPEFAVASLDALLQAGCNIVGVITAPDTAAGRGMQLQQSAVKKYAIAHGLNILQPVKLKDPEFIQTLEALKADLQIVVAFRMLPAIVWNMPPMGTVNLHGSLLPQYRGAAPINWAIINGETETGVTTFLLKHEIDTGDILLQERLSILEDDDAGSIHDKMKELGAAVLVNTVMGLAEGSLQPVSQENVAPNDAANDSSPAILKPAPKIHTDTCRINFSGTVETIYNFIRGLSPYPAAFMILNEKMLKVFKAKKENIFPAHTEGDLVTDGKTFLKIAASNGYIHLLEVQMEGKKRMKIEDFLRGFRNNPTA